jgi:proline iminopeptidase
MRTLLLLLLSLLVAAPAIAQADGYVTVEDGTRLYYKIEGNGPETLVMVHGGPGFSLESIRADFAPLAANRRLIYYDQRGNGRSGLIDDPARLAVPLHIADLEAIRRHFGLEKMNLLGNSWGSLLISAYAAAHPDRIERLILDSPAPPREPLMRLMDRRMSERAAERFTAADRAIERANGEWLEADDPIAACRAFAYLILKLYVFDPAAPIRLHGNLCSGPPEVVRRSIWVNRMIWRSFGGFDLRREVGRVAAPVLVIHGVADVVPPEGAREWAASFPDARLLMLERAGHLLQVEQPGIFFPAIETFLAGRWPDGAEAMSSR